MTLLKKLIDWLFAAPEVKNKVIANIFSQGDKYEFDEKAIPWQDN